MANASPKDVNTKVLGPHWSADKKVAHIFAVHPEAGNGDYDHRSRLGGTIVHARVPMSSVETNTTRLREMGVQTHDSDLEKEVPLKREAPVEITGMTRITEPSKVRLRERKRNYNPPRKGTA